MPPAAPQTVPPVASPIGLALARMREIDRGFDPARFLAGAEQAFRMIVAAFASGDRVGLRALLSDETYKAFEEAIAAREKAGETQISEIKSIQQLAIEDAELSAARSGRSPRGSSRTRSATPRTGRAAGGGHGCGNGDHRPLDV